MVLGDRPRADRDRLESGWTKNKYSLAGCDIEEGYYSKMLREPGVGRPYRGLGRGGDLVIYVTLTGATGADE